jgi:hypothetical protein
MHSLRAITEHVVDDEKAWSLREVNLVKAPLHQWRRYQVITVIRGDCLTEWWKDLGPVENFTTPQIEIPSLGEHSVVELRYMADQYRHEDDYWGKFAAEKAAESSIIPELINQLEENQRIIHNRSSFGPGISHQRNGFPLQEALAHGNVQRS